MSAAIVESDPVAALEWQMVWLPECDVDGCSWHASRQVLSSECSCRIVVCREHADQAFAYWQTNFGRWQCKVCDRMLGVGLGTAFLWIEPL